MKTIEDIFKKLLPHGKPDCTTHLQEIETIDQAISRMKTLEELYKMYWMLAEKSKGANQGMDHAKILRSKA